MLNIGIDAISIYTSNYYLPLSELAKIRNVSIDKYHLGLGQHKMSVATPDEDIVTLAANVVYQLKKKISLDDVGTILFATESGIDQSKSAGIYVHHLVDLPEQCRIVELKQACYSSTAGLQIAAGLIARNPKKKVLLIASDISRYGLNTPGEPTQGCAAVAMLVSINPRILTLDMEYGLYANDVMDFWRPNYCREAIVDGQYSSIMYLRSLEHTWEDYKKNSYRQFNDIDFHCYHVPIARLAEKAHKLMLQKYGKQNQTDDEIQQYLQPALHYPRNIGNSYSASLYVCFASLLDNSDKNLQKKRIGFYSYGSGCMAEYFSGVVQKDYKNYLLDDIHKNLFNNRQAISISEYENFHQFALPQDGSNYKTTKHKTGNFRLFGCNKHKRIYEFIQ